MSPVSCLLFFIVSHLLLVSLAHEENNFNPRCPPFYCGILGYLTFPFFSETHPGCGLLKVDHCNETAHQRIILGKDGPWFYVTSISQDNSLTLRDKPGFDAHFGKCNESLKNLTIPSSPLFSFELIPKNQSMYECPRDSHPLNISPECSTDSEHFVGFRNGSSVPRECKLLQFKMNKTQKGLEFHNLYTGWFRLQVNVIGECCECNQRQGQCQTDNNRIFHCANATVSGDQNVTLVSGDEKFALKLGLGLGIGIGAPTFLMAVLCIWFIWHYKNRKYNAPSFHSSYTSSYRSSNLELELGSVCFGVPIFSYSELAEATNNFSNDKKLGDGGFGTVYYAKLRDGREVAVKRLHEYNYRRVKQFMNEIEILTSLRHKNLVSLYGCGSRHSQQGLLLVYEYIPNGTVADHLHGDRVNPGSLTWPIRMNIAIETASALAYLHASDIIHRDVKTNNILLDNNFCVKVADFGLSRLFPTNVTHISTAPQGSPGYVDPEYHQCYLLTDRSDVYSFGVVLIELISSMPAVDITRHRNEINLANLAINRIQNYAIDELIDPCLGYHTDEEFKRMTTSVAELAFLCLQQIREMRPSMYVVLEELKRIESGGCKVENKKEGCDDNEKLKSMQPTKSPPECDKLGLLKHKHIRVPSSPIPVTAKVINSYPSTNVSR